MTIGAIHHITAITGDAVANVAFYTRTLGLRMVKRTVNFDDPGTWHLYYGDAVGSPGTILTFFPFVGARQGRTGTGQAAEIGLSIPRSALSFWQDRLAALGIAYEAPVERMGETVLGFRDPDGLRLELIATDEQVGGTAWSTDGIAATEAIRGVHSVTLWEREEAATSALLTGVMGYRDIGKEGDRRRLEHAGGGSARYVDLRVRTDAASGSLGAGTIHHVAWRVPDDAAQATARGAVAETGLHVTPVLDRQYFRSIYFREPGGVICEIATDPPGFAADEPLDALGTSLKLPPWLEGNREAIELRLPSLESIAA